jgi:hypothetical protein
MNAAMRATFETLRRRAARRGAAGAWAEHVTAAEAAAAAAAAAADDHQRERAVLTLAHEDEVPAGHPLRLGRVVLTRRDVEEAVELGLDPAAQLAV